MSASSWLVDVRLYMLLLDALGEKASGFLAFPSASCWICFYVLQERWCNRWKQCLLVAFSFVPFFLSKREVGESKLFLLTSFGVKWINHGRNVKTELGKCCKRCLKLRVNTRIALYRAIMLTHHKVKLIYTETEKKNEEFYHQRSSLMPLSHASVKGLTCVGAVSFWDVRVCRASQTRAATSYARPP